MTPFDPDWTGAHVLMTTTTKGATMTTRRLLDSETNEVISPVATTEQIEASDQTPEGHILVSAAGEVVEPDAFAAASARKCYVE